MEEERKSMAVVGLIEKATNSVEPNIDPRLLMAIKSVVRYSDSELRIAAQTLINLMKRDHSQVRYLSLLIIDELFMRSKLFRTLLVENLDQLLSFKCWIQKKFATSCSTSRCISSAFEGHRIPREVEQHLWSSLWTA